MDVALKNTLWNVIYQRFWRHHTAGTWAAEVAGGRLLFSLWAEYLHEPLDEANERLAGLLDQVKRRYVDGTWIDVYDFVEFVVNSPLVEADRDQFRDECNIVLEKHLSAYRFIGTTLVPITSEEEIISVEQAMSHGDEFKPVAEHLETALARLGDRPTPDCRNSIKESISAVEAVCQLITDDATAKLGKALKLLGVHPALEQGFSQIYGYTSDASGIRHALSDAPTVGADDAQFFLVSCSAFVSYLIARFSKSQHL